MLEGIKDAVSIDGPLSLDAYVAQIQADLKAERPGRGGEMIPDDRAREGARSRWERLLEKALTYGIGLPVQRQEVVSKNVGETPEEIRERLRNSPETRQALRRMLDELDAEEKVVDS